PGDTPDQFSVIMERRTETVDNEHWNTRLDDEMAVTGPDFQYTNSPAHEKMLQTLVFKLRCYLRDKLPEFMVPSQFVFLESLPLNANGKMDREALPMPAYDRFIIGAFVPPKTPLQEMLAGTWREVLGIEQIGITDNFFELGGDSIRALRVVALIQKAGLTLSTQEIFKHQTIGELAEIIQEQAESESSTSTLLTDGSSQTNRKAAPAMPHSEKDFPLADLDFSELRSCLGGARDADIAYLEDSFPLSALAEE